MYKLILLDFYMPGMNGDEVARRIDDIFKDHSIVKKPYICCISGGGEGVDDKMIEAGCDQIQMPPLSKKIIKILLEKSSCHFVNL